MGSVRLDTTLVDLYHDHGIQGDFTLTSNNVFMEMDLDPEFPRETIYPEDKEPVPCVNEQERSRLRKIILGLRSLRKAFGVGNMDVIVFSPHGSPESMKRVLSQLPLDQQHRPRFVDLNRKKVPEQLQEITQGRKLLYWFPQGWMQQHDCLIDPDMAYEINSKRFLITSGIRTPPSEIVSLVEANQDSPFLSSRPLPFAVKLCRSCGGSGTWLVTTEDRRRIMEADMAKYKARGGTEVLVSAYVDWKDDLSVHFLIGAPDDERNRENPLIVGVSVQKMTATGNWTGAFIDYAIQSDLANLVIDTVRDTTRRLPVSFIGWGGVDVVVEKNGKQWVVDLNARYTGAMPLCFMSGHFWSRLGLRYAEYAAFQYGGAQDDIFDLLAEMIESGEVVIFAVASIDVQLNMADVVWGGKDQDDLLKMRELITLRLEVQKN